MMMMKTNEIETSTINDLRARLRGELLSPGDAGYDAARRIWNAIIDKHPALIIRCAEASDVVSAVRFAREKQLPVAVRSGGHSVAGHGTCDDGLVIDLSRMKRVRVEPERRRAWTEAGVTV